MQLSSPLHTVALEITIKSNATTSGSIPGRVGPLFRNFEVRTSLAALTKNFVGIELD